jgi:hypothetical protein
LAIAFSKSKVFSVSAQRSINGLYCSSASSKSRRLEGGSSEANRLAVVILEVLAGGRTPADAARVLGMATPRYYQLETRALQGLVAALEPRPQGKQPSPQGQIAKLEKALEQSRRECIRQQTLIRAAQRSLGIKASAAAPGKPPRKDKAGRKKRRPAVRALKAAQALAKPSGPPEGELLQQNDHGVRPPEEGADSKGAPSDGVRGRLEGVEG